MTRKTSIALAGEKQKLLLTACLSHLYAGDLRNELLTNAASLGLTDGGMLMN
ncbi:hypothetical protein [Lederbergia graminis]|uniref:Uncharacterized protein n=1 Tax=Lederbergia graminis TaxID=735518 RepID=A0ABW0LLL8_9BACI